MNSRWMNLIVLFLFLIIITTLVVATNLETIEPGTLLAVNMTFPSAGSNTTYYFQIPKNATIFSARMNIAGYNLSTQYPDSPFVDISNDGDISINNYAPEILDG